MTLLALLSTLTASGWVLLAISLALGLEFVSLLVACITPQRPRRMVGPWTCLLLGAVWAWLLWLLTPALGAS